jgi:holo-[acyl-carrier protein] synthase
MSYDKIFINTGVDIVYNNRISKHIYNQKFIKRILSDYEVSKYNEISNYRRKIEFLAGRFAAKEAVTKAISFKINFNLISISNSEVWFINKDFVLNKLSILFNKAVKDFIIKVSISHEKKITVANSIIIVFFN